MLPKSNNKSVKEGLNNFFVYFLQKRNKKSKMKSHTKQTYKRSQSQINRYETKKKKQQKRREKVVGGADTA